MTEEDYASVAVGSGNRGKRAETTHDPNDVVPFAASISNNETIYYFCISTSRMRSTAIKVGVIVRNSAIILLN